MESLAIRSLGAPGLERTAEPGAAAEGSSFADTLRGLVRQANEEQLTAESQARSLVSGEGDIVDTMIAVGRAEVSMKFVVSLRNRALEAYQEVMRLQV